MLLVDAQYSRKRIKEIAISNLSSERYDYRYDYYSTYIVYRGVPITAWSSYSNLYNIKVVRTDTNKLLAKKTSCSIFGKDDFIDFLVSTVDNERRKHSLRRKEGDDYRGPTEGRFYYNL